jgi:hypothetical protein
MDGRNKKPRKTLYFKRFPGLGMAVVGLESPPDSPTIFDDHSQSGAQSGALRAPGDNLADAGTPSPTLADPAAEPVAEALLMRFLDAWNRLCGDDRLRLADEAIQLATAAGVVLEARAKFDENPRP